MLLVVSGYIAVPQPESQKVVRPLTSFDSLRVTSPLEEGRAEKRRTKLMGEGRTDLFDTPDRTAFVELSLFTNERWKSAGQNPDVKVRRLFADQGSDHPRETAEFHMQHIVHGFP